MMTLNSLKVFLVFTLLFISEFSFGNNIQVANVTLTGQNTTDDYTLIEFDISWENSWRVVGGPGNWDAAWVFVKYRVGPAAPWLHAWINNTGHTAPSGSNVDVGLLDPASPFNNMTNPGMGVFIHRSGPGSGTFSLTNVQLRWNYGDNGLSDNEQVDIKVFAIEHVYVPEGAFYVGSGGIEPGAFYAYDPGPVYDPFLINSEGVINVGTTTGYLYYQNPSTFSGDQMGPIPSAFPKGFKAFYAMKYEISQKGYVDFLNTLTRTQQINRVRSNITSSAAGNFYVLENSTQIFYRNGIACRVDIPDQPAEVEFFCNLNSNGTENEAGDGLNLACNFLSWADQGAYLDWAGLRMMTELEYEKCGRGTVITSPNEFAWGNSIYYLTYDIYFENGGLPNETFKVLANGPNLNSGGAVQGPFRCGALASETSDRTKAGASYYGVMELSGNLWERAVTAGNPAGRAYIGNNGDGILTSTGNGDVISWPDPVTGAGLSFRGGAWSSYTLSYCQLSDRSLAANMDPLFYNDTGCRGVRTAPQ